MPRFRVQRFVAMVKALPLTIVNLRLIRAKAVPLHEEKVGALSLTASHQYMPVLGNVYAISIFEEGTGARQERQLMRSSLIRELGEPLGEDMQEDRWLLFFRSDNQTPPETDVHRRLGRAKLSQLCSALSPTEMLVVDEALRVMEVYVDRPLQKAQAVLAVLSQLPPGRFHPVNMTVLAIIMEYARTRPGSRGPTSASRSN